MVPLPSSGRVFSDTFRAGLGDCAPGGRVRMDAIARWLQDIAWWDVEDAGLADSALWILRRTRIQVHRFPRIQEPHLVRTFPSGLGRIVAERRTVITTAADPDTPLVDTEALWVHLDAQTRRPHAFTPDELKIFGAAGYGDRVVSHRLRQPRPEPHELEQATQRPWQFRHTETDMADHVNNAAYWAPLEEEFLQAGNEPQQLDAEVEFRDGAYPGAARYLANGKRRWLLAEHDELLATFVIREG